MKNLKLLFGAIVLAATTLTSCSKDDDNNSNDNAILGKWVFTKEEALDANGKVVSTFTTVTGVCDQDYEEFFGDKNGLSVAYDSHNNCEESGVTYTWKIENDQLLIFHAGEDSDNSIFNFKMNGDVMELTRPLKRWEASEYELNVTQLKISLKKK